MKGENMDTYTQFPLNLRIPKTKHIDGYSNRSSDRYIQLNNCGKEYLSDRNYCMCREHGRLDFHILYITAGYCYIEEQGELHKISAGNIIVYKPFEPQRYSFMKEDASVSCYIHFAGVGCEQLLKDCGILDSRVTYVGFSSRLETLFQNMEEEFFMMRPQYSEVCSGLLLQFLAMVGRIVAKSKASAVAVPEQSMDRVCTYIYQHYMNNAPISFYAKMCNLSETRFSHVFKEIVGVSPKKYVLSVKLSIAQGLISSTSMSIQEIAEIVGIENVSYFSRIMKKYFGHSPLYFRK